MSHELDPKALAAAGRSIAADTPLMQMHRSSEIAAKAVTAYIAALPLLDDEFVERLDGHMGAQDVPVLLRDCRLAAARITSLTAEVEAFKTYSLDMLHRKDEQFERAEALQSSLTAANELLAEARRGIDMIHNGLMDPSRPRQSVGEVAAFWLAKIDVALSQRLAGSEKP